MPKTINLGLELTTDNNELFETWREFINGDNEHSMANIVDAFAGAVMNQISNLWGIGGAITIEVSDWDASTAEIVFATLGENDAIIFSPFGVQDKERAEEANIYVTTDETIHGKVYFIANKVPDNDIKLNYFVIRGKANE